MLEQLKEWFFDPRVAAVVGLMIGCYILRDAIRALLYILDSTVVRRVGLTHDYSYDEVALPLELLHPGTDEFSTYSGTEHHGIEVLWPGIALKVRYDIPLAEVDDDEPTAITRSSLPRSPDIRLLPNVPNPFNGETLIRFWLAERRPVELAIYDLVGQPVAELAHATFPAGTHSLRWDGRDPSGHPLASGIYLYRLQSGESRQSRRLLLLR